MTAAAPAWPPTPRGAAYLSVSLGAVAAIASGCSDAAARAATTVDSGWDGGRVCACANCEEAVNGGSPAHVQGDIDYAESPPVGGAHDPCWASWGAHADEVRPENWVHNLEHGGVVFLYWCPSGCAGAVADLSDFADTHERALLTPYTDLPARFAFVSWGHRLFADCHDMDAVRAFYDAHVGRGLESVTAGPPASCR